MTSPNLFAGIPERLPDELFDTLLSGAEFRLERIVSQGHATPPGQWYDQDEDEWVLLLQGAAALRLEERAEPVTLRPGDHLLLPARCRHRVEWTAAGADTVWLALFFTGR
ncbi:MAG: cupin domain-containing protein [Porticoccaceae bacterium]|jgi:cupin 2 domain-containing protein